MEQKKMALSNAIILTSILSVLVVALQIIGVLTIKLEVFAIALGLIPICLGAFYGGPYVGAILGGVFAVTVLCTPSTWVFLKADPFAMVVIALLKGVLCGYLAGLSFSLLTKINNIFASVVSATICSLVNTFVFLGSGVLFLTDNIQELTNGTYYGIMGGIHFIWSIIADNFIFEFALTIMVSPLILLAVESIKSYIHKKHLKKHKHHYHRRPHYIEKSEGHNSNQ